LTDIRIEKALSPGGGRYVGRIEGVEGEAEIRFAEAGPNAIRAEHTHAPDSMRGTGAALALVEHMVADARTNGFRIVAVCPYIRAQLKRRPEWGDVTEAAA
jgi:uncharacterized protein